MRRRTFVVSLLITTAFIAAHREANASVVLRGNAVSSPGVLVTTETVTNWSGSASKPFVSMGLQFAKGDMPSGKIPQLQVYGKSPVVAQFDERVTWSDGSLKTCVCSFRDDGGGNFAANESRAYQVFAVTGSYNNTGTKALADITGSTAFNVAFSSVQNSNGSTRGSGAFTADFNTMSGTATRVYKYHSGAVRESWEVWGMATDNSGGAADAHLKTVWYVSIWKNNDGSINDYEYGAVVALDWWSVASADRLNYTATLKNSTSIIYTYSSIAHPYRSQWMTVRTNNDNNHARRPWVNAIPTLYRKPSKGYLVSTGLIPPYDATYVPSSIATIATGGNAAFVGNYSPCSSQGHRADVDQVGGYPGRGPLTLFDTISFMTQDPADNRYMRTNAFAGLHVPYHYKSNHNRTISSGSQAGTDTANTVISLIMRPLSSPSYDFTAQGMPAAVDAYTGSVSAPIGNDSYVTPTGGKGVWTPSGNSTHGVSYNYFVYLMEGERHFMQSCLELATNTVHQQGSGGGAPQFTYINISPFNSGQNQSNVSIPSTQYSGIGSARPVADIDNRNVGWGQLIMAHAAIVCPDADVQNGFVKLLQSQQGVFAAANILYFETAQLTTGSYANIGGTAHFVGSPWMDSFNTICGAFVATAMEDANWLSMLNSCMQYSPVGQWESATQYRSSLYRQLWLLKPSSAYDRSTNPFLARSADLAILPASATSNTLTYLYASGIPPATGDVIYFSAITQDGAVGSLPAGFTEGTAYYAVNASGLTTQVAATPGGTPLSIANGTWNVATQPAAWNQSVAANPPDLPVADDYPTISYAALVAAKKAGATAVTDAMVTRASTFLQNVDYSGWPVWKLAA